MKLKKIIKIILIILFIIFLYSKFVNSIIGLKINWNIELPYTTRILYYKTTEPSLVGDGTHYTSILYKSRRSLKKLNNISWIADKNVEMEMRINELLDILMVDEKNRINFDKEYKYYIKTRSKGFSNLYLIYIPEDNIVHIIENYI